jgi:hypothetical protein
LLGFFEKKVQTHPKIFVQSKTFQPHIIAGYAPVPHNFEVSIYYLLLMADKKDIKN